MTLPPITRAKLDRVAEQFTARVEARCQALLRAVRESRNQNPKAVAEIFAKHYKAIASEISENALMRELMADFN